MTNLFTLALTVSFNRMKNYAFILIGLTISPAICGQFNGLPKGFSAEERIVLQSGQYSFTEENRGISTPPEGPLRTMAEWEEIQTLVITWTSFPSILAQIVDYAQEECEVLIACSDSIQVKNYLAGQGIPPTNVSFIQVPFNSIWIRDYGAHTVYKNDVEDIYLVDWVYNRPRPNDNAMPDAHGLKKNIPVYNTSQSPSDLVNTGGNWMVDGAGTAFASALILEENEPGNPYGVSAKTEAQVDQIVEDFMGINRYIKMEVLPYDDIHHIDMHMKLLDEETLLVGAFPEGISDGPQIEANLQYVLSNYMSVYGTPYKVIRIPMPPNAAGTAYPGAPFGNGYYRTYANNVFVNKTVIVPSYREEYDTVAQRILSEALPGYIIKYIDVDNSGANLISNGGAIHCITNAIGVANPLLIRHQQLADTYDDANAYEVQALVKHASGIAHATLYYSINNASNYQSVAMSSIGNDLYAANIPAQAVGTIIYYYIEGTAVSGKQQVRPIVAPEGYFKFKIRDEEDVIAGVQSHVKDAQVTVFPNPAGAITCIHLEGIRANQGTVSLKNVFGQTVAILYSGSINGEQKVFFQAQDYPLGTYIIAVYTDYESYMQKIIIR
jgi:agmatine deiminase